MSHVGKSEGGRAINTPEIVTTNSMESALLLCLSACHTDTQIYTGTDTDTDTHTHTHTHTVTYTQSHTHTHTVTHTHTHTHTRTHTANQVRISGIYGRTVQQVPPGV